MPSPDRPMTAAERAENEKTLARVISRCNDQGIELDMATSEVVAALIAGVSFKAPEKVFNKDWWISMAMIEWARQTNPATRQRAFEYACSLMGHGPAEQVSSDKQVMDVLFEETSGQQ